MRRPTENELRKFFQSKVFLNGNANEEECELLIHGFYKRFDENFDVTDFNEKVAQMDEILNFPIGFDRLCFEIKETNSITVSSIDALHYMGVPITGILGNLFELPEFEILLLARTGQIKFRHFQLAVEELTKSDGFLGVSPKRKRGGR